MRTITSIVCSIVFLISGVMMAITAKESSSRTGYKTMAAATVQQIPTQSVSSTISLPQDLLLDLAKKQSLNTTERPNVGVDTAIVDSLKQRIITLEQTRLVTKVKWRKAPAPPPVVKTDTIQVPVYYLATQVGTKEGPTGECISVYEVHKVDEICPDQINSCIDNDVGD